MGRSRNACHLQKKSIRSHKNHSLPLEVRSNLVMLDGEDDIKYCTLIRTLFVSHTMKKTQTKSRFLFLPQLQAIFSRKWPFFSKTEVDIGFEFLSTLRFLPPLFRLTTLKIERDKAGVTLWKFVDRMDFNIINSICTLSDILASLFFCFNRESFDCLF